MSMGIRCVYFSIDPSPHTKRLELTRLKPNGCSHAELPEMDEMAIMAGRRPKPTAIKEFEGQRGHRTKAELAKRELEPKPAPGAKCPHHLSAEARKEWRRITPELERLGVLTMVDESALAACCQLWGRHVELEKGIAKEGMYIDTPVITKAGEMVLDQDGKPYTTQEKNPKVAESRLTLSAYRNYCVEFGMTPSSRARISVPKDESKTEDILD